MDKSKQIISKRPTYPTNKVTFSLGSLKNDEIYYLELIMSLNQSFGIEVLLEDSLRWVSESRWN